MEAAVLEGDCGKFCSEYLIRVKLDNKKVGCRFKN